MNDKLIMENYLLVLKSTVEVYVHGTLESSNNDIRNALKNGLDTIMNSQANTYQEMVKYGLKDDCGLTLLLENRKNYFKDFNSVYDVKDNQGNDLIDGKYNFLQFAWLR